MPPAPKPPRAATLLPPPERHLVSRFSYGITPQLAQQVRRQGGAEAWFERQLRPSAQRDKTTKKLQKWFPSTRRSPADLWQRQIDGVEAGWEVMDDYGRLCLLRRMGSRSQVLEVMTEFWENHLHVAAVGDAQFTHRVDYGDTIRKHALGRFDELLLKTTVHPAMLIYLDAASSTKEHPNENLGRELLELHTVGAGNYDEKDVRDSARILTGFSVDAYETWRAQYNHDDHYTGKVRVLGFKDKNKLANGKALTSRYLKYLAHHPATARHLAEKLCVKFVGDRHSKALVRQLARVYLQNDTAIVPVLRALVASPAFRRAGGKVRDPGEDVVATYRALGVKVSMPSGERDGSALQALIWQADSIGQSPYTWGQPDGQPIDDEAWSSPARLLASMRFHSSLAGGYPEHSTLYRSPERWLPGKPGGEVRFDHLVDHLARHLLHRPASKGLVKACGVAVDCKSRDLITEEHELVQWRFPRLLTTLLDTPDHLSR